MKQKVEIVHDSDYVLRNLGIKLEEIRCKCGHKLLEIKKRNGSVIRLKCKRCGTTVEVIV